MKSQYPTVCFRAKRTIVDLASIILSACALILSAHARSGPTAVDASAPNREKLRISDPALAKFVAQQGGELIADYGSFQVFRVADAMARDLSAHQGIEIATDQNSILLNAGPLDTTMPGIIALRQSVAAGSEKRLHLVHFAGPIKPEWRAQLEATGVQIVTYIPNNAYLVYGSGDNLTQMQSWAAGVHYVQWDGAYLDIYKLQPGAVSKAEPLAKAGTPASELPSSMAYAIQMVQSPADNAATLQLIDALKLEPVRQQYEMLNYLNVVVRLDPTSLQAIATRPEVVSIALYPEPRKLDERQDQIMAGNLTGNAPSGPGYLAWLTGKGFSQAQFTASGFAIDLSDSGLDNGTAAPGHFGLYQFGDTNLASRIAYNRLVGTPHTGSTIQGCDGHGTLNSHIMAGYNDLAAGFPHTDASGFHYGLGICPFVKVGSSVIFDPSTFTSPNYANLHSMAYNDGSRVSGNSWGAAVSGAYTVDSQSYDALVRDAQPTGSTFPVAGNQEMVIVFAAGNNGAGAQTVGSPGTAKNVITVGAAENVHSHSTANGGTDAAGDDGCAIADVGADNANDIISFSSRGPCTDGRKKPEIVGPGTHVTGGVAQNTPPPPTTGTGSAIACFDGTGVCALTGGGTVGSPDNFFPLGQQFFTTSSGTSHSTPATAGSCALLRQYFLNLGSNAPSPAMTKAYLMNAARYMNGVGANDTLWSTSQGMGEVNLGTTFDGTARVLRDELTIEKFTAAGQTRTYAGVVSDPSKPFRVTLAWTDAPGATSGNAYNNDLDLTVTVGGNSYKGNVFSGANSATGGTADAKNNAESVFVPAGVSGSYVVTVTAANINSDGVPNEAPTTDQDYALVIYNAILVPTPVISAETAAVTAESCAPANGVPDPGETVTVSFALRNVGSSNTTSVVATLVATNGVTAPSAPQNYGALIAGGATVTQSFSFTATGACGTVISPILQIQDGALNLGTVTFSLPLGVLATVSSENFDSVTAPALPGSWATAATGSEGLWVSSTAQRDTLPNAAFTSNAQAAGVNELDSPVMVVPSAGAQLSFRHSYATESGYDGCVLEIKIGAGAYADILAAGGTFASGGYSTTLNTGTANPLTGRPAWSGNSGGFITTVVNLPASTAGQTIQVRWRLGSDASVGATGWFVDTFSLSAPSCCGSIAPPVGSFTGAPVTGGAPLPVLFTDASFGLITNRFWDFGNGVTTNTTATNVSATYGTPGSYSVSLTVSGPGGTNTLNRPGYINVTNPIQVIPSGYALLVESCTNGALDPAETVTVNLSLRNTGTLGTSNLVATLQASGGITLPSGPQLYGVLPPGGTNVSRPFTFNLNGACGTADIATLQLQEGPLNLGTVTFSLPLGVLAPVFSENFDGVVAPALPPSWATATSGAEALWVTSISQRDTLPNAAFTPDATAAGVNELDSPGILVPTAGAQLSFRHNYTTELGFDGCVLELKIGAGAYADIIAAGGSFVSGGYNASITGSSNPLVGRAAWTGSSGGFITTVVNLPASTAGQNIQVRWRLASDSSVGATGWFVDTVSLNAPSCCGVVAAPIASFTGTPTSGGAPLSVLFTDTSFGSITNRFWDFGNGVTTNTSATSFSVTYATAGSYGVSLTVSSPAGTNTLSRPSYITATNTVIQIIPTGYALLVESCTNGALDPVETVTVNLGLRNAGSLGTSNLVATLQSSGGVVFPSGPQPYGALPPGGPSVSRPFTFTLSGVCGGTNTATLQLQEGPLNLGTVTLALPLGQFAPMFSENFDGVVVPALPVGWTSTNSGGQPRWVTTNTTVDTAPNTAFSADVSTVGVNELVTPVIALPSAAAQLSFRNNYILEASSGSPTTAFDGGVLEIKIGAGAFTDILAAGGSFAGGGYNRTVSSSFSNPLAGRQAWSGNSGGFTNTIVNLPAAAAGQNIQLKWRCGTDSSTGAAGWRVDTVSITTLTCCSTPFVLIPEPPPIPWPVSFSFSVLGTPGSVYAIEGTTNFSNWTVLGTVTNITGNVSFTDTNSPLPIFQAYRARLLP